MGEGLNFDELSSVIVAAHELKAPLSLIRQLSMSLASLELSQREQREIIEHMKLTSERALRLTTDLTRSQSLQTELFELEPINPQQICQEVVYEMTPRYRTSQRQIRFSKSKKPLLAVANKDLLRRILVNFADNAIHYSQENSAIELLASTTDGGETVRIGVRDYGPATSKKFLQSLDINSLLRPQQINARPESSGLGLMIASKFASAMNGTIGATRHRNGTTFFVDVQASKQMSFL